ncbi:MAG TPA: pyridoxamine kinase [Candidatus Cloacimonadota bacterium]|nr:pyridoxamine kinase [Candidatus Cloacimonadota bacterium]
MKRILAIHDLSGWGHTSLLACIPIMYSRGLQVAVLPSCILSTNTDYPGYRLLDLSVQMQDSIRHWKELGVSFSAVYSGFLSGPEQIGMVREAILAFAAEDAPVLIDPVMADAGKLYSCYDFRMVEAMRTLLPQADIITPNLSEAALLLGENYNPEITPEEVWDYCRKLQDMGAKAVLITSACHPREGWTATMGLDAAGARIYHESRFLPSDCPGAGDVFASVLLAALLEGKALELCVDEAAEFVSRGIRLSLQEKTDPKDGMPLELMIKYSE